MVNEFFSLAVGAVSGALAFFAILYRMRWKARHKSELHEEAKRAEGVENHPKLPFPRAETRREERELAPR
jgi:hypothetical protein